jgi:hypothetical protein
MAVTVVTAAVIGVCGVEVQPVVIIATARSSPTALLH